MTAFFTAYYMFRLVFLVFTGESRFNTHEIHPHESPLSMTIPLVLLAIPSAILGLWIGLPPEGGKIHAFLDPVFEHPFEQSEGNEVAALYLVQEEHPAAAEEPAGGEHHVSQETIIAFGVISTVVAAAGIFTAWLTYGKQRPAASRGPEPRAVRLPARQVALGRALRHHDRQSTAAICHLALASG